MTDTRRPDLDAVAREILDTCFYMTLGTADADGRDSRAPVNTGQAVYMAATAAEVAAGDLERALELYPGRRGLRAGARAAGRGSAYRCRRSWSSARSRARTLARINRSSWPGATSTA